MHAFSSKERDVETGLSYFGARYYSSDLSIWLSVDPMSDKYPSTSPYAYCRNNPVKMIDINGLFDSETRATRVRDRAAKRYGEDRVSSVYNKTIDGGKANYSFSIYGEGKTKYSRDGGTNEKGGPIITCDKPDKIVSKGRDYRSFCKTSNLSVTVGGALTVGAQYGAKVDIRGRKIGIEGNVASIDLASSSITLNNNGISTENYLISPAYIQGNSGLTIGQIGYSYYSETSFEKTTYSNHSLSVMGISAYNSNKRENDITYSFSASAIIGLRINLRLNVK